MARKSITTDAHTVSLDVSSVRVFSTGERPNNVENEIRVPLAALRTVCAVRGAVRAWGGSAPHSVAGATG